MDMIFKDWGAARKFSSLVTKTIGKSAPFSREGDATRVKLPAGLKIAGGGAAILAIGALLQGQASEAGLSPEEYAMVLDAMRRSSKALNGATESQLAEYVSGLAPEQLQGFANNVKGIYHEMLFVADYNATNLGEAAMHEATNHPGSDVYITGVDGVVTEFQVKATNDPSSVYTHMETYPDVTILVTDETAAVTGAASSGFSNEELTANVSEATETLVAEAAGSVADLASTVVDAAGSAIEFVGEHGVEVVTAVGGFIINKTAELLFNG